MNRSGLFSFLGAFPVLVGCSVATTSDDATTQSTALSSVRTDVLTSPSGRLKLIKSPGPDKTTEYSLSVPALKIIQPLFVSHAEFQTRIQQGGGGGEGSGGDSGRTVDLVEDLGVVDANFVFQTDAQGRELLSYRGKLQLTQTLDLVPNRSEEVTFPTYNACASYPGEAVHTAKFGAASEFASFQNTGIATDNCRAYDPSSVQVFSFSAAETSPFAVEGISLNPRYASVPSVGLDAVGARLRIPAIAGVYSTNAFARRTSANEFEIVLGASSRFDQIGQETTLARVVLPGPIYDVQLDRVSHPLSSVGAAITARVRMDDGRYLELVLFTDASRRQLDSTAGLQLIGNVSGKRFRSANELLAIQRAP